MAHKGMTSKRPTGERSGCPISIALETLGDAWSLLIVRDLMFKGRESFQDFARAEEGIATNILTDRLRRLEAAGIVVKRRDANDGRRTCYRLTGKGIDLAPVLTELVVWSARHHATEAPEEAVTQMVNDRKRFLAQIRREWERRGKEKPAETATNRRES